MFLNLIKIVVKNTLHQATEEWGEEIGLPETELLKMRERRLVSTEEALRESLNSRSCNRELTGLAVGVNGPRNANLQIDDHQPPEKQTSIHESSEVVDDQTPAENVDIDDAFVQWLHRQRQSNMPWAVIATLATEKGVHLSENALQKRYRRWFQRNAE